MAMQQAFQPGCQDKTEPLKQLLLRLAAGRKQVARGARFNSFWSGDLERPRS
jgi:hypothetical protein